jgi:nucleoside-diphosphate-sugar epimerase
MTRPHQQTRPADEERAMRVLVVGASGAIGTRLIPQLIDRGHEVTGTCHSPGKTGRLRELGAEPVVLDALDAGAVRDAVTAARPDAIIYQATALAGASFGLSLDRTFGPTNRLRTEGTDALLVAAREAGVRRFVAQSFAPYRYERCGGPVKTEDDPLDPSVPKRARQTFAAMSHLDRAVTGAGGIALRYGGFYGEPDTVTEGMRKRRNPMIGDGRGIMSVIHLHDAAVATVLALEHEGPAIYNITDDDPAPASEWMPVLAEVLGAKPPRRIPTWIARLIMGDGLSMMTESRGASNEKAKKELGWTLRYPTWREGFRASYGPH